MTIETSAGPDGYPRYRQSPQRPHVVQSQARFRAPWLFEAEFSSPVAAQEWIWQRTRVDGGAWIVVSGTGASSASGGGDAG